VRSEGSCISEPNTASKRKMPRFRLPVLFRFR